MRGLGTPAQRRTSARQTEIQDLGSPEPRKVEEERKSCGRIRESVKQKQKTHTHTQAGKNKLASTRHSHLLHALGPQAELAYLRDLQRPLEALSCYRVKAT